MRVDQVTELELDRYVNHRLGQGRKESTVNREMQYLLQSMRLAKRKKLIKDVPHYEQFSEQDNVREGFFEASDFRRLVAFLPEDLQDYVRFGYLTGWRKNEITQLRT